MMDVNTRQPAPAGFETRFGRFDAGDAGVIEFPDGIPGFERCRRWVIVGSADLAPLKCLVALDAPEPSFLTVEPSLVFAEYDWRPAATRLHPALEPGDGVLALAIVTPTEPARASVNLKAPILIDTARMRGCQVILDEPGYPVDFPI